MAAMRTLALTVAYDGTDWAGFQRLSRHPSIQRVLEKALSRVLRHAVEIEAAGRTDAGVHALGQVISLRTENPLPVERIPLAVNRLLPASVFVRRAGEQMEGFHARHSAWYRRYWYFLQSISRQDPVRGRFCWQVLQPLDAAAMHAAIQPLIGRFDFAAFCRRDHTPCRNTMRRIQRAQVRRWREQVVIDVQADAFLPQMMRLLVANLVKVGCGVVPVHWMEELLLAQDRDLAGKCAPPRGLFLMRIGYHPNEDCTPCGRDAGELSNEELSG